MTQKFRANPMAISVHLFNSREKTHISISYFFLFTLSTKNNVLTETNFTMPQREANRVHKMESELKSAVIIDDTTNLEQKVRPFVHHHEILANWLFIAFQFGSFDCVVKLIQLVPELARAKTTAGLSPVHIAAENGRVDVLEALVEVDPDSVLEVTPSNETALNFAAKYGKVAAFSFLMQQFFELGQASLLHLRDHEDNTVSDIVISMDHQEIIKLLRVQKVALSKKYPQISSKTTLQHEQQRLPKKAHQLSVETTILAFFAGSTFAVLSNYSNMFQPEHPSGTGKTHYVVDILYSPSKAPLAFYLVNCLTEVFMVSMIKMSASLLSSPESCWSFLFREIVLILMGFLSLAFLLMMKLFVPHFFVKVFSSEISSFLFGLLLDLALALVLLLGMLAIRKVCYSNQNGRKMSILREKSIEDNSYVLRENIQHQWGIGEGTIARDQMPHEFLDIMTSDPN